MPRLGRETLKRRKWRGTSETQQNAPALPLRRGPRMLELFRETSSLFDDDDLATPVYAAVWANMVGSLQFPAVAAGNQFGRLQENVATAVALPVPADSLLG
jgi:hypothetical protein